MIALTDKRLRSVLSWLVVILLAVPVGGALYLGVAKGESPCILCWAERTSMVLIALVALFVIRYGPRPRYLGMLMLLCGWGMFMALRHSALHLARDVGQGFAGSILGAHTYVWAFVIHFIVLIATAVLLLLTRGPLQANPDIETPRIGRFAIVFFIVIACANALQAFASVGPPPHIGQGDPIRLSWNPKHWVWGSEEAEGHVSLRGSWTIPQPDADHIDADPARGPIRNLPAVNVQRWLRIGVPLNGALTDLALDPSGNALAITDRYGVYLLDSTFSRVLHHVVIDPGFSVDLTPLAAAAFLSADTFAVLSTNKSYVLLAQHAKTNEELEWRHFLSTDGSISELNRSRFATVRARQQYVLSLAYDASAQQLITISVPTPRQKRMVVSRFDASDFVLSSEFLPKLAASLILNGNDRSLADYYVTGATVQDGKLYAISAAYSTLLVIDLTTQTLTNAFAIPGIAHPVGIAARNRELLIAQKDGKVAVVPCPCLRRRRSS